MSYYNEEPKKEEPKKEEHKQEEHKEETMNEETKMEQARLQVCATAGFEGYVGLAEEFLCAVVNAGYKGSDAEEILAGLRDATEEEKKSLPRLDRVCTRDVVVSSLKAFGHPCVLSDGTEWTPAPQTTFATLGIGRLDVWRTDDTDIRPRPALGSIWDFVGFVREAFPQDWGELGNPLEEFEPFKDDEDALAAAVLSYLHPADSYDLTLGYRIAE